MGRTTVQAAERRRSEAFTPNSVNGSFTAGVDARVEVSVPGRVCAGVDSMSRTGDRGRGGTGNPAVGVTAEALAEQLGMALAARGERCATAESCTGGGIAWTCTAVAGASDWFECGLVTYSLAAKRSVLGVPAVLLDRFGAVSEPVARAMAEGARTASRAALAMAVTGVAGPGGGDVLLPVGTVWFAWSLGDAPTVTAVHRIDGDRRMVRDAAVHIALRGALAMVDAAED